MDIHFKQFLLNIMYYLMCGTDITYLKILFSKVSPFSRKCLLTKMKRSTVRRATRRS